MSAADVIMSVTSQGKLTGKLTSVYCNCNRMLYGELYNSPHGFFVRYTQEGPQAEDAQADVRASGSKRPSKEATEVQQRWINFKVNFIM